MASEPDGHLKLLFGLTAATLSQLKPSPPALEAIDLQQDIENKKGIMFQAGQWKSKDYDKMQAQSAAGWGVIVVNNLVILKVHSRSVGIFRLPNPSQPRQPHSDGGYHRR